MKVAKEKRTGGFTLIELIVVIAILGILAGVGTVAYTGYVKAAHKGVDEQMISDVAYSMYLASYADPNFLEGEAYVVGLQHGDDPKLAAVKAEGATQEAAEVAKLKNALEMSFGTGCTDNGTLALTYDGWKLGAVNGVLSLVSSSYHGKEEQLLGDIQTFTDSLDEFLTDSRLSSVLSSTNSDYAKYLASMGATTSREVANATTLYLAQYAASKSDPEQYAAWWSSGFDPDAIPEEIKEASEKFNDPDDYNTEEAYDATGDIMMFYAAKVAAAEAAYQYVINAEGENSALTEKFTAVQKANGLSSLMTAVTEFNSAIKEKPSYNTWCNTQAANDAKAYIQCLNAINESSDSFSGNLSQQGGQGTGLYTDGKALSMVKSYVSTAQALEKAGLTEDSNAVAVTVCKDSNGKIIVTVYKDGKATTADSGNGEDEPGNVATVAISGNYTYTDEGEEWDFGTTSQTLNVGDTVNIQVTFTLADYNDGLSESEAATIDAFRSAVQAAVEALLQNKSDSAITVSGNTVVSGESVIASVTVIGNTVTTDSPATIISSGEHVANYSFIVNG